MPPMTAPPPARIKMAIIKFNGRKYDYGFYCEHTKTVMKVMMHEEWRKNGGR